MDTSSQTVFGQPRLLRQAGMDIGLWIDRLLAEDNHLAFLAGLLFGVGYAVYLEAVGVQ